MSSKPTKQPKPEDMLLRVIRVAEILVKTQDKTSEEIITQQIDHTKVRHIQGQKNTKLKFCCKLKQVHK